MESKRTIYLLIVLIIIISFSLNCGRETVQEKPLTCKDVKSIKIGMTPDQVEALLGPPSKKDLKMGVAHYLYQIEGGIWIIKIQDGKVTESTNLSGNC